MPEEIDTCYVCMEEETGRNPFLRRQMCDCSKADSSLKIHQLCLELMRDRSGKCGVCKTALSGNWAFEEPFRVLGEVAVQFEGGRRHGAYYGLGRTGAHVGPVRYLESKGTYRLGNLDGQQITFREDGSVNRESEYCDGIKHGLQIVRDRKGEIMVEEPFVQGKLHGLRKDKFYGFELRGMYDMGVKVGEHYEIAVWSDNIRRVNYVNGKRHGKSVEFNKECGEGLANIEDEYFHDDLHGTSREFYVNKEALERRLKVETQYAHGLRNGRHAEYDLNGELYLETAYSMGREHGVFRSFKDGKVVYEITYEKGVKHGPVRKWNDGVLVGDAEYKHGLRHGRFIKDNGHKTEDATYWSDGSVELLNGPRKLTYFNRPRISGNYSMGVRHGTFETWDYAGYRQSKLNYTNGELDGECILYMQIDNESHVRAIGTFKSGVPVGQHKLYSTFGEMREYVNYNTRGQLHGTSLYFLDGKRYQELTFKDGVLHGRQCQYQRSGLAERVFNMRNGKVHGFYTAFDERGVAVEQMPYKADDGIQLGDIMGDRALCYPSERMPNGVMRDRWMNVNGELFNCEKAAAGVPCDCYNCDEEEDWNGCDCCYHNDDASSYSQSSYIGRGRRRSMDADY